MTSTARRLPVVLALAAATSIAAVAPAFGTDNVTTSRIAGNDRYSTAAAIAQTTFPNGSNVAVLASGERFPDALAASYMAGRLKAPLLLTAGGSLSAATERKLSDLNVSGVSVVGGAVAVSDAVVARLRSLGYEVDRTSGQDRYGTARAIAELFPASFVGSLGDGGPTAIVASGEAAPDALAGAPVSYAESFPVLLTPKATLSNQATAAFSKLGISQVVLLGGPAAVTTQVEDAIKARNIRVIRIFGNTREATAARIADFEVDNLGWSAASVFLARGDTFADALAGGPLEGLRKAPLLLATNPGTLSSPTAAWLQSRSQTVASITALGGESAVSNATLDAARRAATPQQ